MKNIKYIVLIICFLTTSVFADIPHTLNYQGRLMDQSGQPVTDGQYTVTFRLYTAASGGNMVWEEQQTVMTNNGYFNTVLGNTTALSPSIFNQPLWTGMQINSNPEMIPRQKLSTTAYAMTVADGAITTQKMAFDATLPIGTIMAWHKSMPNVPQSLSDTWMECNGQVINDSESPLNGQNTPILNLTGGTGKFLRGSDHSGDDQNDSIKSHSHQILPGQQPCYVLAPPTGQIGLDPHGHTNGFIQPVINSTDDFGDVETRPVNMSVVWIIKIK